MSITFTTPINTCDNYEWCGNLVSTIDDYCDECLAEMAKEEEEIATKEVTHSVLAF